MGLIPEGWAILVVAVFSALVYVYALSVRLPTERVVANIRRSPAGEPSAMGSRD